MATSSATTVVAAATRAPSRAQLIVARPPRPGAQLRVARADTLRCAYSKDGLKACSAMNLSPAVLKGLGLWRVSRPWGSKLVEEEDTDAENTRLHPLSRALNREWILACVLGHIFLNPGRLRRYTSPTASRSEQ